MLRIRSLTICNFGPYLGEQRIDFYDKDGVFIVFGDNMRGKTTLLNAVRFALFGKILGRGEREIQTEKLLNYRARQNGTKQFSVTISLEKSGDYYEVERTCTAADTPEVEPKIATLLCKNTEPQNQTIAENILAKLLPEKISRFFLFDGELLQQYEELLIDESAVAGGIRDAIESILGVPVLIKAREDLTYLLSEARKAEARAAKQNRATEALAVQFDLINTKLTEAVRERTTLEVEITRLTQQIEEAEDALKKNARAEQVMNQRDSLQKELADLEMQRQTISNEIGVLLARSWHWPLVKGFDNKKHELTERLVELTRSRRENEKRQYLHEISRSFKESGVCPVCGATDRQAVLENELGQELTTVDSDEEDNVRAQLLSLNRVVLDDQGPAAIEKLRQLHRIEMDIQMKRSTVNDLNLQLLNSPEDVIKGDRNRLASLFQSKIAQSENLKKIRKGITDIEDQFNAVQRKIKETGGNNLTDESRRRELIEELKDVFAEAVGRFREDLRMKVERSASELFKRLTTEPEYDHLVINDNYGLQIRHKDGHLIELRSSGAEHIVALSLVGALQANSPLSGPLFIDSPFGRLDEGHVERVLTALPEMAKQVVLFVYRKEMSETLARRVLGNKLVSEFELYRISGIETEIRPVEV